MQVYKVVILREKDGRFTALIPALGGCATWGETLPEALRRAEEAALAYLDGLQALSLAPPPDSDTVTVEMGDAPEACIYRLPLTEGAAVA